MHTVCIIRATYSLLKGVEKNEQLWETNIFLIVSLLGRSNCNSGAQGSQITFIVSAQFMLTC